MHARVFQVVSLNFFHHQPVYTSPLPYTCYMIHASYSFQFVHTINICWRGQIIKLIIMYFLKFALSSSLLGPNILHSTLFWNTLNLCSSFNASDNISYILFNYFICATCALCATFPCVLCATFPCVLCATFPCVLCATLLYIVTYVTV